jgi:hypothetical protein
MLACGATRDSINFAGASPEINLFVNGSMFKKAVVILLAFIPLLVFSQNKQEQRRQAR